MAIYDTMNYIPNDVATVGMGLAASMGQFLLCAGTKGKRYALPHARIMMHQPSSGMGGSASDIKIQAAAVAAHQEGAARADRRAHRPDRSSRSRPTPTATAGSPPTRPSSTASSTRSIKSAREAADEGRPAHDEQGLNAMNYYIPQWEERTSYGFRRIDPYAKLFEDRIIYLGTPISDDVANAVIAQLLCLQSMNPDQDISIYINSPGGSFTALTAIYDTMKFIKPDVQTVCIGQAASAAAILLAAGTPGKRLALPNSRILIHQPYTEGTVRPDLRHRDPGQRDPADARAAREDDQRPQRSQHRAGQPRHRARQDPDRRAGRRVRPDRRRARVPQGHARHSPADPTPASPDASSCPAAATGAARGTVETAPRTH